MCSMKNSIVLGIIILVASVCGLSQVYKTTLHYSCCNRTLSFDRSCENIWSVKGQTFARVEGNVKECDFPCKTIEDERMTLGDCVNITQAAICTDAVGSNTETRIYYLSQACTPPVSLRMTGNRGSADWMLLTFGCILLCII